MKDNVIYNRAENEVYVKTDGIKTVVICNSEKQMEEVNTRLLEDIELNLNKFSEKMLPEEITADQILKLTKIIEE